MPTDAPSSAASTSRLLLVDDHPLFITGVREILTRHSDHAVIAEAHNAPQALQALRTHQPDLALVDVTLPGTNGIELTKMLLAEAPALRVLVLSMHDECVFALRALRAGARGYLMKSEPTPIMLEAIRRISQGLLFVSPALNDRLVFRAIESISAGRTSLLENLSERETEVFERLGRGLGTTAIARELGISPKTVETHRAHLREKLHLANGADLVEFARDWMHHREG